MPKCANVLNYLSFKVLGTKASAPRGLFRVANDLPRTSQIRADRIALSGSGSAEFADRIAGSPHSHVAFDIFDTLVTRTVAPEQVKLLASDRLCRILGWSTIDGEDLFEMRQAAERDLCQRTFAHHQELEFRFNDLADEMLERLIARALPLTGNDRARLRTLMLDCELAVERSVLRPIPRTIEALDLARRRGKTIIFISDFYLSEPSVARLLEPFVSFASSDALFVSCDRAASKRSGRLFPTVCAALDVSPSDLLMVGDNFHSDYTQARANGIDAVLVDDPGRTAYYKSAAANPADRREARAHLSDVLSESTLPESRNLRAVVPSLYLFIEKLYAHARRSGFHDLCFLAREGEPLRRMFDIYQSALGCPDTERVRTHYLLVSRRSCYAPSLRSLDIETFEGLFRYYVRMSARDFLQSLGLSEDHIRLLSTEIDTDFDETIEDFPASKILTDLRKCALFRTIYDEHRGTQRANLRTYLGSFGIPLDKHPLVLVDVGWKGSIQDYLRAALPNEIRIEGCYFGLLNVGQPLADKSGLVFTNVPRVSQFYRTYSENRTLFELLLCADHGSALRYERREDDRIGVVLDEDADELDYIRDELISMRDDVIAAFRAFCEARNRFCLAEAEITTFAAQVHARLVFRPWRSNARMLAAARHRENFGTYVTSRYSACTQFGLRDKWRFWRRLMRNPRATLLPSFWPSLTLFQHTNRLVTRLYAACRRSQDYRVGRMMARNRLEIGG
jgi:predicted HAD superfamily hydrolase